MPKINSSRKRDSPKKAQKAASPGRPSLTSRWLPKTPEAREKRHHAYVAGLVVIFFITAAWAVMFVSDQNSITILGYDQDRALSDDINLTSFGGRIAGSDANKKGAEYIKQEFIKAGLTNVHIEEYQNTMYEVKSASASLLTFSAGMLDSNSEIPSGPDCAITYSDCASPYYSASGASIDLDSAGALSHGAGVSPGSSSGEQLVSGTQVSTSAPATEARDLKDIISYAGARTLDKEGVSGTLNVGALALERTDYTHMYDFAVQGYSGTTDGTVKYDIVDVGNGTDAEYSAKDVEGKAVIVSSGKLNNTALLLQASKYKVGANIIHNVATEGYFANMPYSTCPMWRGDDGLITKAFPDFFPDCKVPSIVVSTKVGNDIRNAVKNARTLPIFGSTVKLELNLDVPITKKPLLDVVGEIKGTSGSDSFILMGAHHDSPYNTGGAIDNTCGTVTLIEAARQIGKHASSVQTTIRFAAWDGEEIGLRGSTEYFKAHKAEIGSNMVFYMNFDWHNVNLSVSADCSVRISDGKYAPLFQSAIDKLFKEQPKFQNTYNFSLIVSNEIGADSDAYYNVGKKPVSDYRGSSQFYIHTPLDSVYNDKKQLNVNPESWALGGIICSSVALKMAGGK